MSRSAPPHELGIPERSDGIADRLRSGMVFVPSGTFRMGSDHHYPEETPSHRVSVDSFWIDEAPVTNAEFPCFVDATNYVTFAELTPKASDRPGKLILGIGDIGGSFASG